MSSPVWRDIPAAKRIRYGFETGLAYAIYGFFRLFSADRASAMGGGLMRWVGPKLGPSRTARKNLAMAFPEKTDAEREQIVAGMWENLGRIMGEYPHLHRIWRNVELVGHEHMEEARISKKAPIFFSAHLANWEINAICAKQNGVPVHLVYRKPNNPGVDSLLRHARDSGAESYIEKGGAGARQIVSLIRKGETIGLLMDQKMNEGIAVPFFGFDAMTAPAMAHFALMFGCPVYPSRMERLGGANFRMTIYPKIDTTSTGDRDADTLRIMTEVNRIMEDWIRARPEQWLWIHHRWPKDPKNSA